MSRPVPCTEPPELWGGSTSPWPSRPWAWLRPRCCPPPPPLLLLVRPEAPLALLQRLPLLRGVLGRALALLLGVGRPVLAVGQRRADPAAGVPGLAPEPRDVSLHQAALHDAVRLLWRRDNQRNQWEMWGFLRDECRRSGMAREQMPALSVVCVL